MYFLPKSNKLIAQLVMIHPLHLYLISFVFIVLFLGTWFFSVYAPINRMVEQQRYQIKQAHDQSNGMSYVQTEYQELSESVGQAVLAFDSYRGVGDYTHDVQQGMISLMDEAEKHAISINAFTVGSYEDKDWYVKQNFILDLTGSYEKIINFLQQCIDFDYMIQLSSIYIHRMTDGLFQFKAGIDLIVIK